MTGTERRKLLVIRHALDALEEYLSKRGTGLFGGDLDIETLIIQRGAADNVTNDEAWNAIDVSLVDAFRLSGTHV